MVAFAQSPDAFKVETDGNLGAVEIATFLSLVLLGISLSQGYTYFQRSEQDGRKVKIAVSVLLLMEIFHSFTASHTIYYDTVTRWNRAEINSYSLSANVATETLITFVVQCFFCHRILRLSKNLLISGTCFALSFLRLIGGIAMSAECVIDVHRTPNWVTFIIKFNWLVTSALALGGATDILIAAAMLYYLRRMASPTNMKSTTQVINRLARFSLQTGLITSMTSLAVIICFQAMRNLVWFGLYIILAKVYSNSLLASLNSRRRPRRKGGSPTGRGGLSTHMDFATAPPVVSIPLQVTNLSNTSGTESSSDWRASNSASESKRFGEDDTISRSAGILRHTTDIKYDSDTMINNTMNV